VQLSKKDHAGIEPNTKSFFEKNSNSIWMLSTDEQYGRLKQVFLDGRVLYYAWPCYNKVTHNHTGDVVFQPRHNAEDMVYDPKRNSVWINSGEGLLRFSLSDKQFHRIGALSKLTNLKNDDRGVGIDLDRDGRVWVGTYTMGIFIYDPEADQVRPLFTDPDVQQKVGAENLHIYCDPAGITWISNWNGKGLYELLPINPLVKRYNANPSKKDSLSSGMITTIVRGPQGKLWIGTADGLNIFDPIREKFEVLRAKDLPGLKGTAIIPLYIDTLHHTAWLNAGSQDTFEKYFGMQMYEMDLRTMQCRPVVFKIGTKQLDRFVISHTLIRPYEDGIIFPEEKSRTVFELKRGNLVANPLFPAKSQGGYGGMVVVEDRYIFIQNGGPLPNSTYEKIDGKWTKIPSPLDSLLWGSALYSAKDKTYWVSSRDELIHYDKDFAKIRSYKRREGYHPVALNMEFDDEGNIWLISETKKISRVNIATGVITTLSEKDGHREQDNYWFAPLTKDAGGNLYLGIGWKTGVGDPNWGLDRIYPERYAATNKARIYLSALAINQKPFMPPAGLNGT
jgi:streptogramin lyase